MAVFVLCKAGLHSQASRRFSRFIAERLASLSFRMHNNATMIGVGAMIGAGIFVLTGHAAGAAGPAFLAAFLLNGMVTLFTAASYQTWD